MEIGFVVVRMPTSIAWKQNMDIDVKNISRGIKVDRLRPEEVR